MAQVSSKFSEAKEKVFLKKVSANIYFFLRSKSEKGRNGQESSACMLVLWYC